MIDKQAGKRRTPNTSRDIYTSTKIKRNNGTREAFENHLSIDINGGQREHCALVGK